MKKKLRTLPVTIDAEAIAVGLLDMFDNNERTALRFGMLPAPKMRVLEEQLQDRFRSLGDPWDKGNPDILTSVITGTDGEKRDVEWSLGKLVQEAMHEITLALYQHGELVV